MLNTRHASAGALLTVDLDAIRANYRLLREKLGGVLRASSIDDGTVLKKPYIR